MKTCQIPTHTPARAPNFRVATVRSQEFRSSNGSPAAHAYEVAYAWRPSSTNEVVCAAGVVKLAESAETRKSIKFRFQIARSYSKLNTAAIMGDTAAILGDTAAILDVHQFLRGAMIASWSAF